MTTAAFSDPRGVRWTASSQTSGNQLIAAMHRYFCFYRDALDKVDALLVDDPDCAIGWVLRGYLLMFARKAELIPEAQDALARASLLAPAVLPHESKHIRALAAWCDADSMRAQRIWDDILLDVPHDLLALRVQHFNTLFLGRPDLMGQHAIRALKSWSDDIPGAGFAWSTACMGLEEVGEFRSAEALGRKANALEPDDLWSLHSVAHVFEAEGRLDEGLAWMDRPGTLWEGRGSMRHHLWWHEALFLYENGAYDQVLDYYDTRLAVEEAFSYLELSNSASLLCRLEAAGVSCGARWSDLAKRTAPLLPSRGLTFSDVHALIVFAFAEDGPHLVRLAGAIQDYAASTDTFDGGASKAIGVPIAKALAARAKGDSKKAATLLHNARPNFSQMGGSNAQRDILDILMVDLALAADDKKLAQSALNSYLDVRPHSVPMRAHLDALEKRG